MSAALRESTNQWFDHTLLSRLDDQQRGAIILIMQRLHEDDLTGRVLEQQEWDRVSFPAIAEADEVHHYATPSGLKTFCRRAGQPLHPDRQPLETPDQLKRVMGANTFAGQYQQMPAPAGGGLVKVDWFRRYEPHQKPDEFDRIVQSWDTANKVSELSDYSVCTTWGIKRQKLFLLHVMRKQLEYPELRRAVLEQQQAHGAGVVLIEDKASGTQLIQDLIQEGLAAVTKYKPAGDKIMRMHAQTAVIENGFVHLPTEAPWLEDYLRELAFFPNGRYDDQVDSTAQFLDWFKKPMTASGIFYLYKEKAERTTHPERFRSRLELPPGNRSSHVRTLSGINLAVDPDGSVEMSDADAAPLITQGWKKLATRYVNNNAD